MVLVEPGTFMMGTDSHIHRDERPAFPVRITTPYYIAKYPVTFDDYDLYCESTGRPLLDDRGWGRGSLPAFGLSWHDATEYCKWLTLQSGLSPAVQDFPGGTGCDFSAEGYRLPTEAEWEFAARGGNASQGFLYAGSGDPQEVAWYAENSEGRPHPVGEKGPNELGLHDLSGNVWEHCWDWYAWNFYFFTAEAFGDTPIDDPQGDYPVVHVNKALRGGSFACPAEELRITNRGYDLPEGQGFYGIRLVRKG
jgi:formylglycine-generating enzyme required for sulfatase activity